MISRWLWITPLMWGVFAHAQNNPNIARNASATASDESIGHFAQLAVDGWLDSDWESSGSAGNPSWIELSWPASRSGSGRW